MCNRHQYVITISIEMPVQSEFVSGNKISAASACVDRERLQRLGLHAKFYGTLVILENLLQALGLLSTAGVNAVESNGISARKIIDFQRFTCLTGQLMRHRSCL